MPLEAPLALLAIPLQSLHILFPTIIIYFSNILVFWMSSIDGFSVLIKSFNAFYFCILN